MWHVALKASDPSKKEPFAVAPSQLDPEFGPDASRRSSEERRRAGRTLRRVVRGSGGRDDRKGRSPRQLRRLPLELPYIGCI